MDFKDWPCWAKVVGAIGLMVFVFNWPNSSVEWASWVQAIGSVGAIVVAVYVLKKESVNVRELEAIKYRKKEISLLISLKTEITTHWSQYMETMGKKIESGDFEKNVVPKWIVLDNKFYVYMASCADLGMVSNDKLRREIVVAYSEFEGLLLNFKNTIEEFKEISEKNFDCMEEDELSSINDYINECYKSLRNSHVKAKASIKILIKNMDEFEKGFSGINV